MRCCYFLNIRVIMIIGDINSGINIHMIIDIIDSEGWRWCTSVVDWVLNV